VTGGQVATIAVGDSSGGGGADIDVTLDDAGSAALASITGELSVKSPPQSQLAIYVLGQVQSAPTVSEEIVGGAVVINGDFTTAQAQEIVERLLNH
jgi:preprotein translocase subunit SecD